MIKKGTRIFKIGTKNSNSLNKILFSSSMNRNFKCIPFDKKKGICRILKYIDVKNNIFINFLILIDKY